jgi:8-oxo-dGTP diphosphatase
MGKVSHDSETLAEGQQVFSVCGLIHRFAEGEHQIFLGTRASTKKFLPDMFELPGGHVDFGESMTDGLRREVMEEFGMRINVGDPFYVYDYQNLVKKSHTIEVIYFATFVGSTDGIVINAEDHSGYGWYNEAQVRGLVSKNREALQTLDTIDIAMDYEVDAMLKGLKLLDGKSIDFA